MSRTTRRVAPALALTGTLALGACAVAPPTGPSIAAMPGKGKTLAEFQQDDSTCRQFAFNRTGIPPAAAAQQSAINSAAAGTLLGAAAGAALGAAAGNPAAGAAIGAGSGLLIGGTAGAGAAQVSGASLQQRYDIAYAQCMSTKGDSVPTIATGGYYGAPGYYAYPAYPAYAYPYPYYPYPYYGPPVSVGVGFGWGWGGGWHHHWH